MADKNYFQKLYAAITGKALTIPFTMASTQRMLLSTNMSLNKQFLQEYKNWVFACVQARAEEIGNMELVLKKDGQQIDDHEILDLINRVNPYMTKHELFAATQAFKDLDGNAYWYLARDGKDGKGDIVEIYPLRSDKVSIVPSKTNALAVEGYIFVQPDGSKIPFSATEILHFKTFNPLGYHPFPHKGMGIVEASQWAIQTDNEARQWNHAFFKNSARPDGLLLTSGEAGIDSDEYNRIQAEWKAEHEGSANNGKVAIMSGGVKWQDISRSQKDMDFMGQRNFSRDEILALFRVPKSILGITEDVNRANAEAAIYVFALRTVKPLMQQMVDALNEFLLPDFDGTDGLEFDFKSPVPEDSVAQTAEYNLGINKWYSRNEVRAMKGLPPTKNGDTFYGGVMDVEIDTAPKTEATKTNNKPALKKKGTKAEKKSIATQAVENFLTRMPKPKQTFAKEFVKAKSLTAEQKAKYIATWKAQLKLSGAPLEKNLKAYFNDQKKEVLKNVRSEMKAVAGTNTKANADDVLFNQQQAVKTGMSLITPFLRDYIRRSGNNATAVVGSDSFDANTAKINDWVEARAEYFAETINRTTSDSLMSSIQEGFDAGESIDDIEKRVADVYETATGSRTKTIAKTEVAAASNTGNINAYQQAGIEKHEWVVVDPQDEDCKVNDGQVVEIGDAFKDGSIFPPDPHPNCQCTTVPVFE